MTLIYSMERRGEGEERRKGGKEGGKDGGRNILHLCKDTQCITVYSHVHYMTLVSSECVSLESVVSVNWRGEGVGGKRNEQK